MLQHEITIHIPSDVNGQTVFVQQEISLNLDKVSFYLRPPMQNQYILLTETMPLPTPTEIPEEKLLEAGLVEVETTEKGKAYIRFEDVVFWTNVELGIYALVFPGAPLGQNKLAIRTTAEEIRKNTGARSVIL